MFHNIPLSRVKFLSNELKTPNSIKILKFSLLYYKLLLLLVMEDCEKGDPDIKNIDLSNLGKIYHYGALKGLKCILPVIFMG